MVMLDDDEPGMWYNDQTLCLQLMITSFRMSMSELLSITCCFWKTPYQLFFFLQNVIGFLMLEL